MSLHAPSHRTLSLQQSWCRQRRPTRPCRLQRLQSLRPSRQPRAAQSRPPVRQPSCHRPLLVRTSDGKLLQGEFWAQPHAAPTIIICHGYRVSGAYLRPVATLEYSRGYNILLFDFRGHGNSESVNTSGGNAEVHDLQAAIAVAIQQPETLPGKIILHGFSMGAAIALLTPPHPDGVAIIADSAYAHLDMILRSFVHWQLMEQSNSWSRSLHWLRSAFHPLSWIMVAFSRLVFRLR